MKLKILSNQLLLLICLLTTNEIYGQANQSQFHIVIEDLEEAYLTCNRVDNEVTFEFCITIAHLPFEETPDLYVDYTIANQSYGPFLINYNHFQYAENGSQHYYEACLSSATIPITENCIAPAELRLLMLNENMDEASSSENMNQSYSLFPIHQFNAEGDIFDCTIFSDVDCSGTSWCNGQLLSNPDEASSHPIACPAIISGYLNLCCPSEGDGEEAENRQHIQEESLNAFLQVSPNPFDSEIRVDYQTTVRGISRIQLIDLSGRVIYQINENLDSGVHQKYLQTEDIIPGLYYLHVKNNHQTKVIKLIKL